MKRILLVEDDIALGQGICIALQSEKYKLTCAGRYAMHMIKIFSNTISSFWTSICRMAAAWTMCTS